MQTNVLHAVLEVASCRRKLIRLFNSYSSDDCSLETPYCVRCYYVWQFEYNKCTWSCIQCDSMHAWYFVWLELL